MEGITESAVAGIPHADLGEGVVAVLVAADAHLDDDAVQSVQQSRLARFKHPRRLFWVDEMPRNAMGKVQKKALREQYAKAFE